MMGIDVVTCAAVHRVFKETGYQLSTRNFAKPILETSFTSNVSTHDAMFMNKECNVFEINSILRGSGVLIPSDVLVSVFVQAKSKAAIQEGSNDRFYSLLLWDIHNIVHELVGEKGDIPIKAFKSVATDFPSVFNFTAGLLLFIGLFPIPVEMNNITGGLLANVFYIIAIGKLTNSIIVLALGKLAYLTRRQMPNITLQVNPLLVRHWSNGKI